jgi:hypothetical protein
MKSTIIKISATLALVTSSAVAYAATANDCCASIECCLQMLACCF